MSAESPTAAPPAPERAAAAERPTGGIELNTTNRATFAGMTPGGKRWANRLYEGVRATPVLGNLVGRMQLAFEGKLINRAESRTIRVKNKFDAKTLQRETLADSRTEVEAMITDLQQSGVPGVERLQAQLRKIDQRINKIDAKRDKLQTKVERRENNTKLFTNRRDAIADTFINKYEKKLSPLETKLEAAHERQKDVEQQMAAAEVRHTATLARLDAVKAKRIALEQTYQKMGMSERKIRRDEVIKQLDAYVAEGQARVQSEKDALGAQKARVAETMARIDKKANPHRDRRDKYARIKAVRPVTPDVPARPGVPNTEQREEIQGRPRPEARESSAESRPEQLQSNDFVAKWNQYLYAGEAPDGSLRYDISPEHFFAATGLGDAEDISFDTFADVLKKYLIANGHAVDDLPAFIDTFYEKYVKPPEA